MNLAKTLAQGLLLMKYFFLSKKVQI